MPIYKNENGQLVEYTGGGSIAVDSALSITSTNVIMNKAVAEKTEEIDGKLESHETAISSLNTELGNVNNAITTNLLNPTLATTTANGVTCTNNGDGIFTLNGTCTLSVGSSASFNLCNYEAPLNIPLKFCGCPIGGSSETYNLLYSGYMRDFGEGKTYTFTQKENVYIQIVIYGGVTYNNLIFKPMLTTNLNATYDDFVPYTGDTGTINGDVAQVRGVIGSDAWNSSTIYSVGAYAIHNNSLWKCLVQNSGQEPTEGTYWTCVTVSSEISKLNVGLSSQSTKLEKYNNEFSISNSELNEIEASFTSASDYTLFEGETTMNNELGWIGFKHNSSKKCYITLWSEAYGFSCGKRDVNGSWSFRKIIQW